MPRKKFGYTHRRRTRVRTNPSVTPDITRRPGASTLQNMGRCGSYTGRNSDLQNPLEEIHTSEYHRMVEQGTRQNAGEQPMLEPEDDQNASEQPMLEPEDGQQDISPGEDLMGEIGQQPSFPFYQNFHNNENAQRLGDARVILDLIPRTQMRRRWNAARMAAIRAAEPQPQEQQLYGKSSCVMMSVERTKMCRATWEALKVHVIRERKRKQDELEANAEEARQKLRREQLKKQHKSTLQESIAEIKQAERRLSELKEEKHAMFLKLKKVLNDDETRRRQQLQQQQQQYQQQCHNSSSAGGGGGGVDGSAGYGGRTLSSSAGAVAAAGGSAGLSSGGGGRITLHKVAPPQSHSQTAAAAAATAAAASLSHHHVHHYPHPPPPPPPSQQQHANILLQMSGKRQRSPSPQQQQPQPQQQLLSRHTPPTVATTAGYRHEYLYKGQPLPYMSFPQLASGHHHQMISHPASFSEDKQQQQQQPLFLPPNRGYAGVAGTRAAPEFSSRDQRDYYRPSHRVPVATHHNNNNNNAHPPALVNHQAVSAVKLSGAAAGAAVSVCSVSPSCYSSSSSVAAAAAGSSSSSSSTSLLTTAAPQMQAQNLSRQASSGSGRYF